MRRERTVQIQHLLTLEGVEREIADLIVASLREEFTGYTFSSYVSEVDGAEKINVIVEGCSWLDVVASIQMRSHAQAFRKGFVAAMSPVKRSA